MNHTIRKFLACIVMGAALSLGGCAQLGALFGDPATVPGALPSEATELRLIRAAWTVQGAYGAIGEQLQRGTLTAQEAADAKQKVDEAAKAVTLASCAAGVTLPVDAEPLLRAACAAAAGGQGGTLADRLALIDALLLELLRAQASK